ncbi:unnamed protein product, partial [Oppiella nova]
MFYIILCLYQPNQWCVCNDIIDVITTSGSVRGQTLNVLNKLVDQFLGIPYAEPPIGKLRFARPQPIKAPRQGIIDATKVGVSCIQSETQDLTDLLGDVRQSEDCLVLNVWTPNDKSVKDVSLKAVMFWIHGGALAMGSIFDKLYNGSVLATYDVVIVSANYRLGRLGFLYGGDETAPANVGFYDQLLALQWVRENIHQFGGDRDQITIFGESAGSWSVSAHVLSPLSKGLYKRAIMQSGALMFNKDRPIMGTVDALTKAKDTARELGCDEYDYKWLDCLRAIDDPNLFIEKPQNGEPFVITYPVFGTQFLPLLPQKAFNTRQYNS